MQQYFTDVMLKEEDLYRFNDDQAHHIKNVMRMKDDTVIRLVDKNSTLFSASVTYINNDVYARVNNLIEENNELPVKVTLILALIKNDKWDLVLQKACELGVSEIVPFESSRTVVKVNKNIDKKIKRWQKILQEASEQCKRTIVPVIHEPVKIKNLKDFKSDLNFVAYEDISNPVDFAREIRKDNNISLVIGPEGGFSDNEISMLNNDGFKSVRLGKRILRAETASMYALSCVSAVLETEEL